MRPKRGADTSIWKELLAASDDLTTATACILTPDTEEAFVRVALIPQPARLYKIQFRIRIETTSREFQGYWEHALYTLAALKYSVYTAHNLMIKIGANSEEAEFTFIADANVSPHVGTPVSELSKKLEGCIKKSFDEFAKERRGTVRIGDVRVTRPRGVGVPCFIATNAKPSDVKSAEVAVWLCRCLERHGFRPVNVDVARGGVGLREQVKELVAACNFMVVLHCPEEKLKLADPGGRFGHSPWVIHEEAMMFNKGGEILSLRFENIVEPAYQPGFVSVPIGLNGLDDESRLNIERRIERWTISKHQFDGEEYLGPDIPAEVIERDLVRYYSGGDAAAPMQETPPIKEVEEATHNLSAAAR